MIEMTRSYTAGWEAARTDCRRMWGEGMCEEALDFFEKHLPEWHGWRERRPLADAFFGRLQGGAPEAVRLHRLATPFETDPGFGSIVTRLGASSFDDHLSVVHELEVASALSSAGMVTRFMENRAPGATLDRCPDLTTKVRDREIFVECFAQRQSESELHASAIFHRIRSFRAPDSGVQVEIEFEDGIHVKVAYDRQTELLAAMDEASLTGRLVVVQGLARVSPLPGAPFPAIPNFRLITGNTRDDLSRLQRSLRNKGKRRQLSSSCAGIVAFRTHHLWIGKQAQFSQVCDWVREKVRGTLRRYPEIGSVVLLEKWMNSDRTDVSGSAAEGRLTYRGGFARALLAVRNDCATVPVTPPEIERIAEALDDL